MEFRKIKKTEVEAYLNLVNQLNSENAQEKEKLNLKSKEQISNLKKYQKAIKNANKSKNHYVAGLFEENVLLATGAATICPEITGELKPFLVVENVIVDNKQRGKGLGKKLMEHLEEFGKQNNCKVVILQSSLHREVAHKFYDNLGYCKYPVKGFKKYL